MDRKYLAFDIETAREFPDGEPWRRYRPLGISCAATQKSDADRPTLWHGLTTDNQPADRMSPQDAMMMVQYLESAVNDGYTLLTWNGLDFDFDILAEESLMFEECKRLALNHVDMMFHLFCQLGHPLALQTAAKGMGLAGKHDGMSGSIVPRMWAKGQRQTVLDYVAQDVLTTLELAKTCNDQGAMSWVARSGRKAMMDLPGGLLTVRDSLRQPEPDTSWMSDPLSRHTFTAWLD